MKVNVHGSFTVATAKHLLAVKTRTLARTRELAQYALERAAKTSPQKTGQFASNWRLSIGSVRSGNYRPVLSHGQQILNDYFKEGDEPAVSRAVNSQGSKLSNLKLGDRIFLSTSAVNQEDGENYAWDIEAGIMRFRTVNPSGGKVLARVLAETRRLQRQLAGKP